MLSKGETTRVRLTYILLGFCLLAVIGSHLYGLWAASQEEKAMLPRLAIDQIIKALRTYHRQVGKFPQSFTELERRVWRHKRTPNFGEDGRSLSMANYFYIYYLIDAGTCTLWAIPINKRREEGSTFFLALSVETARRWKGAPLSLGEIKRLPSVPEPAQLALLGLTEQQPIHLRPSPNGRKASNGGD
ncbi:MAG: hypothetical protein AABN33_04870 [Acidobacteriota bacterium]